MISSFELKVTGIIAAMVTIVTGMVASHSITQGAGNGAAAFAVIVAFVIWVLSAAILLVRLCKGLYATRTQRAGLKSILWVMAIVWALIVVPLVVRAPLGDDSGRARS